MISLEEAKLLKLGEILVHLPTGRRWKVNGKIQTWKRDPSRIRIPLKSGLYSYDALTEADFSVYGELIAYEREAVIIAKRERAEKSLRDDLASMREAHAEGFHSEIPREFCPDCGSRA